MFNFCSCGSSLWPTVTYTHVVRQCSLTPPEQVLESVTQLVKSWNQTKWKRRKSLSAVSAERVDHVQKSELGWIVPNWWQIRRRKRKRLVMLQIGLVRWCCELFLLMLSIWLGCGRWEEVLAIFNCQLPANCNPLLHLLFLLEFRLFACRYRYAMVIDSLCVSFH